METSDWLGVGPNGYSVASLISLVFCLFWVVFSWFFLYQRLISSVSSSFFFSISSWLLFTIIFTILLSATAVFSLYLLTLFSLCHSVMVSIWPLQHLQFPVHEPGLLLHLSSHDDKNLLRLRHGTLSLLPYFNVILLVK